MSVAIAVHDVEDVALVPASEAGPAPIELREASEPELNRDRAEAIRVAYVAATRARDLIVPVCGDQPIEGWVDVLNPVLYPPGDSRLNSKPAPGCPAFGEDSVLDRGPQGKVPAEGSVRPGLHRQGPDRAPVVWWDPAMLVLDVEEQAPLRQRRILEVDPEGTAAAASEQNYDAWKAERAALLARGSQPLLSVQTITSLARRDAVTATGDGSEELDTPPR